MIENPLCQECQREGIIKAAQCVHHITPIESAKSTEQMELLAFSVSNLQSLCFECHSAIHKAERSHSRDAHLKREKDRLKQWKSKHNKNGT